MYLIVGFLFFAGANLRILRNLRFPEQRFSQSYPLYASEGCSTDMAGVPNDQIMIHLREEVDRHNNNLSMGNGNTSDTTHDA